MQGHVENIGVIVEGLLGPIPMVHILREQENWLREDQALSTGLTIYMCSSEQQLLLVEHPGIIGQAHISWSGAGLHVAL